MGTTIRASRAGDVGPELRELRLERGVTQTALAAEAQVGRPWLNEFEAGMKTSAPLDMVMRVAAALEAEVLLQPVVRAAKGSAAAGAAADLPVVDLNEHLKRF